MDNTKSLFAYISQNIVDGKLPEGFSLPKNEDGLVFADGAEDGIYIYHRNPQEMSDGDFELMKKAITASSNHDFVEADKLFNELSKNNPAIAIVDKFQNYIWENKDNLKAGNIYEYAIGLLTLSDNKECIKYGLSILEMMNTNNDETKKTIKTLALSDEFTLFCIHIMKTWENGNSDIFELAKNVYGWGKIHAVRHLRALDPLYDEIRDWLLREGINNDVMPSYSALDVWRNANVGSTLYTKPNYKQFFYIGQIIDALLDESAVQGLSALDKRKEIIMVYLNEAKKMPLIIDDYEVIYHIDQYFREIEDSSQICLTAKEIYTSYEARRKIIEAVQKGKAIDLAIEVGIDVKPYVLSLMKRDFNANYHLCRYLVDNDKYRKELLYIYKKSLPLKQMITLPEDELGLGIEYSKERALEFLLQELRDYPLEGIEFVETALQCKPVRTRNGAISVLQSWVQTLGKPLSAIVPDLEVLLMMVSTIEPVADVKKRMDKLIEGDIVYKEDAYVIEDERISQDTLNILADAISDIGAWNWWNVDEDSIQLEFRDVQLYDYSKAEKEPHSSVIALRFSDDAFALFLDNYNDDNDEKKWYEKFHDDEIGPFPIDCYDFSFNDAKYVQEVLDEYKNSNEIKELKEEIVVSAKYIVAAKCGDVAFFVGGNDLRVLNHQGELSEEDIKKGHERWNEYWKDYWRLRGSKDAYEKDYACEVTIPVA